MVVTVQQGAGEEVERNNVGGGASVVGRRRGGLEEMKEIKECH